ncbi:MAG TPA: HemK2/MTQ2 family protein methyltransferase [Baekduia sp.]|nr:HemK2/MTQ2 family protein methyltransferase [Baekduia sp.]
MRIVTLPGVFSPISDTWLLASALREQIVTARTSVLDVCTGSGALAVCAAKRGARSVTAVDVSRRAVLTAAINARLNGVRVDAIRSDLFAQLGDRAFDVIVSNPPYVPAGTDELPSRGPGRTWDAGRDGRALLDRLLAGAPAHLRPGGRLLVVHSEICGIDETMERMRAGGLEPDIASRHRGPLGPLMRARVAQLEAQGLIAPGRRDEEVVVIRGTAPLRHQRVTVPARAAAPA